MCKAFLSFVVMKELILRTRVVIVHWRHNVVWSNLAPLSTHTPKWLKAPGFAPAGAKSHLLKISPIWGDTRLTLGRRMQDFKPDMHCLLLHDMVQLRSGRFPNPFYISSCQGARFTMKTQSTVPAEWLNQKKILETDEALLVDTEPSKCISACWVLVDSKSVTDGQATGSGVEFVKKLK